MTDPADEGVWLPAAGPLSQVCQQCRVPGGVAVEHRLEWADAPGGGWPPGVSAARLAVACRGCGSDFLSRSSRLVALPEVVARVMPWVTCEACGRGEAARVWAWLVCSRCGAEFRAEVRR